MRRQRLRLLSAGRRRWARYYHIIFIYHSIKDRAGRFSALIRSHWPRKAVQSQRCRSLDRNLIKNALDYDKLFVGPMISIGSCQPHESTRLHASARTGGLKRPPAVRMRGALCFATAHARDTEVREIRACPSLVGVQHRAPEISSGYDNVINVWSPRRSRGMAHGTTRPPGRAPPRRHRGIRASAEENRQPWGHLPRRLVSFAPCLQRSRCMRGTRGRRDRLQDWFSSRSHRSSRSTQLEVFGGGLR
jgi:hypothetical protein